MADKVERAREMAAEARRQTERPQWAFHEWCDMGGVHDLADVADALAAELEVANKAASFNWDAFLKWCERAQAAEKERDELNKKFVGQQTIRNLALQQAREADDRAKAAEERNAELEDALTRIRDAGSPLGSRQIARDALAAGETPQ